MAFNFQVYEMDSDFLQMLVNSAAVALLSSEIECKCLPFAVTMLLKPELKIMQGPKLKTDTGETWIEIDPTVSKLRNK